MNLFQFINTSSPHRQKENMNQDPNSVSMLEITHIGPSTTPNKSKRRSSSLSSPKNTPTKAQTRASERELNVKYEKAKGQLIGKFKQTPSQRIEEIAMCQEVEDVLAAELERDD